LEKRVIKGLSDCVVLQLLGILICYNSPGIDG